MLVEPSRKLTLVRWILRTGRQVEVLGGEPLTSIVGTARSRVFHLGPLDIVAPVHYNVSHLAFGNRGASPLLPRNCNRRELNWEQNSGHWEFSREGCSDSLKRESGDRARCQSRLIQLSMGELEGVHEPFL